MKRLHHLGFLLVISTIGFVTPLFSQPGKDSPADQELIKARKANEEAQAEFYREQTKKLQSPAATPSPTPKTLRDTLVENPASVIGIGGTIMAATIAALVGLMTLFFNTQHAGRLRQDTQFYEALERFGNTESPSMRASAAGLLAQMARTESNDVSVQTKFPFFRVERAQPYLRTALDQLLTGFRLETNNIALGAITAAIAGFIPDSPKDLARKLYRANFEMQDELLSLLAKLFVMNGIKFNEALFKDSSISSVWEHAESLTTPFPQYALKDLAMTRRSVLRALFTRYGPAFTSKPDPASLLSLQDEFRVLCQRLDRNVSLLCAALKENHWGPADEKSFKFSFLVGGDLEKAELSHLDFSRSQMTRAKLTSATMTGTKLDYSFLKDADLPSAILKNASLFGAHLEGADLEGADVSDAAMGKVTIDDFTQLDGCKWWKADLRGESWKEEAATDFNLAAELFKRSGESIPSDLTDVHFSVRDVLPELRALSAADGD